MIKNNSKRIIGLVGAPRSGKSEIAEFLHKTRGYEVLAFADQILKEYGVSRAEFEAAKVAGNAEKLRNDLWTFSEQARKKDPNHFIKGVIQKAQQSTSSVVITDIRTYDEWEAVREHSDGIFVVVGPEKPDDENGFLAQSKIKMSDLQYDTKIVNEKKGLDIFRKYLDEFFFRNDIEHLLGSLYVEEISRYQVLDYLSQFEIREKGNDNGKI